MNYPRLTGVKVDLVQQVDKLFMLYGPLPKQTREEYRAAKDCICDYCRQIYIKHPLDHYEESYDGSYYLHVLCNGDRVKL